MLIPIAINLLPSRATAFIREFDSPDNRNIGLVQVNLPNKQDDQQTRVWCLFHFEDIVDEFGEPAFKDTKISMKSLRERQVDLIARSIATSENFQEIVKLSQKLDTDYPDAKIPLLQAVKVFLRSNSGQSFTGSTEMPTFLRKEPKSFNFKQPATAFYMNISLKNNLDIKTLEFVESSPNIVKSALPHFLNRWFTASDKRSVIKKEIPKRVASSLELLDTLGNSKHKFGEFFAAEAGPPPASAPETLTEHPAKVCLIYTDRSKPRMGLLEVDLTDGDKKTFVFFSLKAVQSQQKTFGDLTNLFTVNTKEELLINATKVDGKSKIPYVATSVWKAREDHLARKAGADVRMLTEEWKRGTEAIIRLWMSKTIEMSKKADAAEAENAVKRAEEALNRADGRGEERRGESEGRPRSPQQDEGGGGEEQQGGPGGEWRWQDNWKDKVGTVQKVINQNFALGVSYQMQNWEEKRFFVLFDTCDVWINGEVLQKTGKGMKDMVSPNDSIKFHAVKVDTENDWNLIYLATAVIVNKSQDEIRDQSLPMKAVLKDTSSELPAAKVQNFKMVVDKLTKKPAPVDPNEEARKEDIARRRARNEARREQERLQREADKKRYEIEKERADRMAQIKAEEAEKKATVRRRELLTSNPELLQELQGMEIQRGTARMYSCKLCGIQAMTLVDAESHIAEEAHKELKAKDGSTQYQSREEAEEALFLNEYKEIITVIVNGKTLYTCEKCKALKLPMQIVKRHVLSVTHKNNHKVMENFAALDQECKEMMKRGRVGVSYFCTPCGFTSDAVIPTKNHLREANHKKRTVNYCHACKIFSNNRAKFQEHRFSIAHKRKMEELEKPPEDKQEKAKKEKEKRREQDKENKAEEAPKEPEDPLKCKVCAFDAENEEAMKEHKKSDSHRRKYYLANGVMPPNEGEDDEATGEKLFTTLEHMSLCQRARDIHERQNKSRSLQLDEETKKEKTTIVEVLFKNDVFQKMDVETTIKCTTCSVKLQGHTNTKKLNAQLFVHFVSDKHIQRLRVAVKGEEAGMNEPEEAVEEEAAAAAAEDENQNVNPIEEEEPKLNAPPPIELSEHQFITDEEGNYMLKKLREEEEEDEDREVKEMVAIKDFTDLLHYCKPCRTGLMSGKYMARHFYSAGHKEKKDPPDWRKMFDLSFLFEFGNLYKCLYCNTGLMNLRLMELHVGTADHRERVENCLNKEDLFDLHLPAEPPKCDTCDKYFSRESQLACHQLTWMHSVRLEQYNVMPVTTKFIDNNDLEERLQFLPAPALPILPARLENQKGRIAAIFESNQFSLIEFMQSDCVVHALFDKSRVVNKDKSSYPVVGYPVIFHACRIEPGVEGVSQYVQYWASQVILGDGVREERLGMEMTYRQLRQEIGGIIDMAVEDCKAELKAELQTKSELGLTVFFDELREAVEYETAVVEAVNASAAVVRLQSSGQAGLLILEDGVELTALARDRAALPESALQPGEQVHCNAVLMDTSHQTAYLCTSVWREGGQSGPVLRRDKLLQSALDMYHVLALALPVSQPYFGDLITPSLADMSNMDMTGVIDMNKILAMGGFPGPSGVSAGYDDLAADDSIAADDNIAIDDNIAEESESEKPKKSFGIKIASFGKF